MYHSAGTPGTSRPSSSTARGAASLFCEVVQCRFPRSLPCKPGYLRFHRCKPLSNCTLRYFSVNYTLMNAQRMAIQKKRLICTVIATVSLFLLFLGMRVPNIAQPHSPKPRPRAVIEASVKAGQEAGTRVIVAVEACQNALNLSIPTPFRSSHHWEIRTFNFTPIEHLSARAPPVLPA